MDALADMQTHITLCHPGLFMAVIIMYKQLQFSRFLGDVSTQIPVILRVLFINVDNQMPVVLSTADCLSY